MKAIGKSTKANGEFNQFIPITKIDEVKREVWGTGAVEEPDRTGEILDYGGSKQHFLKWSDTVAKASQGKSLGNVRAMHQAVAAGKLISFQPDDERKSFEVGAHIVDEDSWRKCLAGVYTGFSIGGKYLKRWQDPSNPNLRRYVADPHEISVVDFPAIPGATFDVVKADGGVEVRKFVLATDATLEKGAVNTQTSAVDAVSGAETTEKTVAGGTPVTYIDFQKADFTVAQASEWLAQNGWVEKRYEETYATHRYAVELAKTEYETVEVETNATTHVPEAIKVVTITTGDGLEKGGPGSGPHPGSGSGEKLSEKAAVASALADHAERMGRDAKGELHVEAALAHREAAAQHEKENKPEQKGPGLPTRSSSAVQAEFHNREAARHLDKVPRNSNFGLKDFPKHAKTVITKNSECDDPDLTDREQEECEDEEKVVKADETVVETATTADANKAAGPPTKKVGDQNLEHKDFAYVGDEKNPQTWHLPVHDATHVQGATARFNQADMPDSKKKHAAALRIATEAKTHGIDASGFKDQYVKSCWSQMYQEMKRKNTLPEQVQKFADVLMALAGTMDEASLAAASAASLAVEKEVAHMATKVNVVDDLLKLVAGAANEDVRKLAPHLRGLHDMAKSAHGHGVKMGDAMQKAMDCHGEMMKSMGSLLGNEPDADDITEHVNEDNTASTEAGLGMAGAVHPEKMVKSILAGLDEKLGKRYDERFEKLEEGQEALHKSLNGVLKALLPAEPESNANKAAVTAPPKVRAMEKGQQGKAQPVEKAVVTETQVTDDDIQKARMDPTGRTSRQLFLSKPTPRGDGECPINTLTY